MNAYFYIYIDRRDFGDLISEVGVSRLRTLITKNINQLEAPTENRLLVVWSTDPLKSYQLPKILICQDETQNDWSAWLTTYASKIRPFSAYMRLMPYSEFKRGINDSTVDEINKLSQFAWPVSGLILGELMAVSGLSDKSLETISATAFASTLSFVMCRASILYADFQDWSMLINRWNSVREVTQQRDRVIDGLSVAHVCAIIMTAMDIKGPSEILNKNDIEVCEACRVLLNPLQTLSSQDLFNNKFSDMNLIIHGSREDRVVAFDQFLKNESNNFSKKNSELIAFTIGYLASRIAPGTIRHSNILNQVINRYPTALLWYGFCAGFSEDEEVGNKVSTNRIIDLPPMARRIIRELFRPEPIMADPFCDIDYSELIALSRTMKSPLEGIIKSNQSSAVVELIPGVCTSVNVNIKQPDRLKNIDLHENEKIIYSMGNQIQQLFETYNTYINTKGVYKKPEQQQLPQSRRKKK